MSLQQFVRSTPPFIALRKWKQASALRGWSAEDQMRLNFYSRFVRRDDLVFDVGANIGNRSKVFLRLGARVVAFEPQSSCAELLERVFAKTPAFRLVKKALGDKPGVAEMKIANSEVLSTLSDQWIDAVNESGRFEHAQWTAGEQVIITTLDQAIEEFGSPAFCKIDVEGYEPQVFAGLSRPLRSGSLEFATEALEGSLFCLEKLARLGVYRFQYSAGETMDFTWPQWRDLPATVAALRGLAQTDPVAWGDVYFRAASD